MNDTTDLYELLPVVYRQRDAEQGYQLRALIEVIAEQAKILEQDISRLYDNWFIETCDEWVVPYIGDLIGVRGTRTSEFSQRAEVANTISYRRRKGTSSVLEQLARDTTGWNARVLEFFELLSTTQYLNHVRLHNHRTPDLRQGTLLEFLNSPFDTIAHSAEVRRIENRHGRYNIANIGIFLWRLDAYPLTNVIVNPVDGTGLHYSFSVLGNDAPLFNHPVTETSALHLAEEINVPGPIRRRGLHEDPKAYYGPGLSIKIVKDDTEFKPDDIIACDLSGWTHEPPAGKVAIDPVLGRFAFAPAEAPTAAVKVSYYYGFSSVLGGGEYERAASFTSISTENHYEVGNGQTFNSIADALAQWTSDGKPSAVIEIKDSGTYSESITASIPKNRRLEIRAANEKRPTLMLTEEMKISGAIGSGFELNGALIANHPIRVSNKLEHLHLQHCTLVPGRSLNHDGVPTQPSEPSLIIAAADPKVEINHCILGGIRTKLDAEVKVMDTIIDGNDTDKEVYASLDGLSAGGPLSITRCTIKGKVHTLELRLAENTIFLGVVTAERRQQGCVRFCYLLPGSLAPKRYRCQPVIPDNASPAETALITAKVMPLFTSLSYGHPGYWQLASTCPTEISRGADDESEMGAFSSLQQPQREESLRVRLEEYLRFGLEAGSFFIT